MSSKLHSFLNIANRLILSIFMRDLKQQMEIEGTLDLEEDPSQPLEKADYMRVEDNGADTTIFIFSGLDVLYAGLARFEFQRVLQQINCDANFVFLRDVHRMAFLLKPDGTEGGTDFYMGEIERVRKELGTKRAIAMGSSIGGSVAFYLGTKLNFDKVIIFGAAFNEDAFNKPSRMLYTFFDMPKLFTEPKAYFELIIVTLAAAWGKRQLESRFNLEELMRPLDALAETEQKPEFRLYYGGTAWPDAAQAQMLIDVHPEAELVALPTGRHNTPAFLKQKGKLAEAISTGILGTPFEI